MWYEQRPLRKLLQLLATTALLLACANSGVSAAQLIQKLPTTLEHGWQRCVDIGQLQSQCETVALGSLPYRATQGSLITRYRKQLIIQARLKNQAIALAIPLLDEADEVYFNGQLIGRSGKLPPTFENAHHTPRSYFIPQHLIRFDQFNNLEIVAYSSRGVEPLASSRVTLMPYKKASHRLHELDYALIAIIVASLVMAAFQVYYLLVIRNQQEIYYLLTFLVSVSLFAFVRSLFPAHLGFELNDNLRLEIFLYAVCLNSLLIFAFRFYELDLALTQKILVGLPSIIAIVALFWGDAESLHLLYELEQIMWLFIGLVFILQANLLARKKSKPYQRIFYWGQFGFWVILLFDVLMQSRFVAFSSIYFSNLVLPFGFALNGLFCSFLVSHKLWQFFKGSTFDHVTGTLLRPAFLQRLSEEMQRATRENSFLLVIMVDIQQVRRLSINYGQSTNNQLLNTVCFALTKTLRPFDLICRINDDEFCIAATLHSEADAHTCLQRLSEALQKLKQPVDEDLELIIDAQVGGVIYNPEHHLSLQQLIQDANYALSKAKQEVTHGFYLLEPQQSEISI